MIGDGQFNLFLYDLCVTSYKHLSDFSRSVNI